MNVGPLRRTTGIVGLALLIPVLLQLGSGAITAEDAAVRAVVTTLTVLALGRGARVCVSGLLHRVERRGEARPIEERVGDAPR